MMAAVMTKPTSGNATIAAFPAAGGVFDSPQPCPMSPIMYPMTRNGAAAHVLTSRVRRVVLGTTAARRMSRHPVRAAVWNTPAVAASVLGAKRGTLAMKNDVTSVMATSTARSAATERSPRLDQNQANAATAGNSGSVRSLASRISETPPAACMKVRKTSVQIPEKMMKSARAKAFVRACR